MIVEKRERVLGGQTPQNGGTARKVDLYELKRYDRETSPFEQKIADLARRIVSEGPAPDSVDGWLLVSKEFFGRYSPNGDGLDEEDTITYSYWLSWEGKYILVTTVEKEYSGKGMPLQRGTDRTSEECPVSEVMRELDFDGYLSYSQRSGWNEHGWSLRYISSAGLACLNRGGILDIKRKAGGKGQGLYDRLKAIMDGAAASSGESARTGSPRGKDIPQKQTQPAPAEKKGPEEELREVTAQAEEKERTINGLRWTALLLLLPALGIALASIHGRDIVWIPITVCVLSFAMMAVIVNAQGKYGGGYVAWAVLVDALILFPLMIFGCLDNWAIIFGAVMAFNIPYAIIWSAVFKRMEKEAKPLREKKDELTKTVERIVKTQPRKRKPMSEAGVMKYTAGMEEAYRRLREKGGEVHTGFPWSAVFTPDMMRDILLCRNTKVDVPDLNWRREGIGRFRVSVDVYAMYGIHPTEELTAYMKAWDLDPYLDDARDWYVAMHP